MQQYINLSFFPTIYITVLSYIMNIKVIIYATRHIHIV